ncbi:hypothetical protein DSCO28_03470 [Desulfosarcina ovata subsp. sediminis]|uniref:O-methyltransferase n=1 Tax=Desulfosarcina ovata subsp. sediminis TaxID=885957 RepID=A0A5K7ZFS7_9BACT|nr:class I SAM-dependent methyltransferase [Desulfosarcina ovata]BBO79781.1 hypothetical protein DSCO28_03470 [Desulfosarcina ovata subsp. sediminis]
MSHQQLYTALKDIEEFLFLQERFSDIFGYLQPLEGYALKKLAEMKQPEGEIVEIGSFMGKSTCWLAAGVVGNTHAKINAVDHFKGSIEHQAGKACESQVVAEDGTTLGVFKNNIRKAKLEKCVNPIVGASEEIAEIWEKPLRLLFIDGDHSYEGVKKDFEMWSPFIVKSGIIAFHDVTVWNGVTRFYRQLLSANNCYYEIMRINTLGVIKKII